MLLLRNSTVATIVKITVIALIVGAMPAQARSLSYATSRPPVETNFHKAMQWWADEIKSRTGGSLKIEFYYMGSLVKLADAAEAVSAGIADMAYISPAYSPEMLPLWYLSNTRTSSSDQYVVTEAFQRVRKRFPELKKEEKNADMKYISVVSNGPQVLLSSTRPYITPADFEGDKVRMPGTLAAVAREADWNVSPVSLYFGDIYSALGRGTIDGAMTYVPLIETFKHNEVGKYVVEPNLGQNSNVIMMNRNVWANLSEKEQQVIKGLQKELTWRLAKASIEDEEHDRQALQEHPTDSLKFYQISEEQRNVWAKGLALGEELMVERMSKFNDKARELHEAYKEEIAALAQEVAEDGYPWKPE